MKDEKMTRCSAVFHYIIFDHSKLVVPEGGGWRWPYPYLGGNCGILVGPDGYL